MQFIRFSSGGITTRIMLKFSYEVEAFYDEKTKIWSSEKYRRHYAPDRSIGQILFEEMRRNPSRICQISDSENTQLTNEEALVEAIKVAKYFESIGLKQSDVVGIVAANTTHLLGVVLACFFSGTAFQALNPIYEEHVCKHFFNITKPKIVFCDGDVVRKTQNSLSDSNVEIITLKDRIVGFKNILDLLETSQQDFYYKPADLDNGCDQTLCIMGTSGSTGPPKAVCLPNTSNFFEFVDYLTADDVQFVTSILEWRFTILSILSSIIYGAKRIITHRHVSPEYFLEIVQKYKVTFTLEAPYFVANLAWCSAISEEAMASFRHFSFGGGFVSAQTQKKLQSYMKNGKLIFVYGLSEFCSPVARNFDSTQNPASVGRLRRGVKAKVINTEGAFLGPNEVGELLLYNGFAWKGYYNNKEASDKLQDKQGWYHTGDLVYFDADSYMYVVGRQKDLLKYHEMHYMPSEVEAIIANMPDVAAVCVFGVYNEMNGDEAAAVVVRKSGSSLTADQVVEYVQSNSKEDYLYLHAGAAIWDALPKTKNNRFDRKAVKRIFMEQKT